MVDLALPLLEYETDVANQCLEIVKSYMILAPDAMLNDNRRQHALEALAKTLDSKSREQVQLGTKSIELAIQAAWELGGSGGLGVIVRDMLQTGLLGKIMEGLHGAWEASQTTGPHRKDPPDQLAHRNGLLCASGSHCRYRPYRLRKPPRALRPRQQRSIRGLDLA